MIICHSKRSEDELLSEAKNLRVHQVDVTEILRYALDDKVIFLFIFAKPSNL